MKNFWDIARKAAAIESARAQAQLAHQTAAERALKTKLDGFKSGVYACIGKVLTVSSVYSLDHLKLTVIVMTDEDEATFEW